LAGLNRDRVAYDVRDALRDAFGAGAVIDDFESPLDVEEHRRESVRNPQRVDLVVALIRPGQEDWHIYESVRQLEWNYERWDDEGADGRLRLVLVLVDGVDVPNWYFVGRRRRSTEQLILLTGAAFDANTHWIVGQVARIVEPLASWHSSSSVGTPAPTPPPPAPPLPPLAGSQAGSAEAAEASTEPETGKSVVALPPLEPSPQAPPAWFRPGVSASALNQLVRDTVRDVVTEGRILFNPPQAMRQGARDRIEVAIARSADLEDELRQGLRGRGAPMIETIKTSPYMEVELKGDGFKITPLSPSEQVVGDTARWEFDVLPIRSGTQLLQVCVSMRLPLPDHPNERQAVPVLERAIRVQISPIYSTREFVAHNWQWLIATLVGLGAAVGGWLALFR
jgi:hypothetical protein